MSGASGNQLSFIFPDSVYKYLNTGSGEITETDCNRLVENINKFDPCDNRTSLKTKLKEMVDVMADSENGNLKDKVDKALISDEDFKGLCNNLTNELKNAPFMSGNKSKDDLNTEISNWCGHKFDEEYKWLNSKNEIFNRNQDLTLNGAIVFKTYFNFMNEEGQEIDLSDVFFDDFDKYIDAVVSKESVVEQVKEFSKLGGAHARILGEVRLNLLKKNRVPVLFTALPHTDYLTKKWRGESATYSSSSTPSNSADCSPEFNSGLDKRHIKAWTPREHGSSASTVNAMSHLRRMANQPRITQVELGSLGPLLARGFMGGSMDGGAQLEVDFKDCESGTEGKNLSVRQSTQYATLFKSVVQRLGHHNDVSENVVNELKNDLEEYRRKECKLFQDAFRLANALKSQNNGTLSGDITSLDAFKEASDEVAKSETHLLGCLTKILTETCKKD